MEIYMKKYEGFYYTGDGAYKDKDGYIFVTGRVDDVLSIAGHRIGTAEIESAITKNIKIVECAVIAVPDAIKGQKWLAFVVKRKDSEGILLKDIINSVREKVGPFAALGIVVFVKDLPKTRSGKIMRRALRKIACGEKDQLGDVSTLTNPSCIDEIAKEISIQID